MASFAVVLVDEVALFVWGGFVVQNVLHAVLVAIDRQMGALIGLVSTVSLAVQLHFYLGPQNRFAVFFHDGGSSENYLASKFRVYSNQNTQINYTLNAQVND